MYCARRHQPRGLFDSSRTGRDAPRGRTLRAIQTQARLSQVPCEDARRRRPAWGDGSHHSSIENGSEPRSSCCDVGSTTAASSLPARILPDPDAKLSP